MVIVLSYKTLTCVIFTLEQKARVFVIVRHYLSDDLVLAHIGKSLQQL
jgi:hypothetical protein